MSDNDTRIEILQGKIAEADLHPIERDAMVDELHLAQKINGSTDEVKQLLKTILVGGVRKELLAHERDRKHFANCVVMQQVKKGKDGELVFPWDDIKTAEKSSISVSIKDGFKATGKAAVIAALVATAMAIMIAFVWWQNSKTRDEFVNILKKNGITQHSTNNTKGATQ